MTETNVVEGVQTSETATFLETQRLASGYVKTPPGIEPAKPDPAKPDPAKAPPADATAAKLLETIQRVEKRLDDKDSFITKLETENKELRNRLSRKPAKPKAKDLDGEGVEAEELPTPITFEGVMELLEKHEESLMTKLVPMFDSVERVSVTQRISGLYAADESVKAAIDSLPDTVMADLGQRVTKLSPTFKDDEGADPIKESLLFLAHRHGTTKPITPRGAEILPTGGSRVEAEKKDETTKMNEEIFGMEISNPQSYPVDIHQ